ncbi:MAG: hypothetical protein KGI75_03605, partial [Rhizobiaceae bacterium]|nr:hypothetical protein [Rhizobiaceae bacterium]
GKSIAHDHKRQDRRLRGVEEHNRTEAGATLRSQMLSVIDGTFGTTDVLRQAPAAASLLSA